MDNKVREKLKKLKIQVQEECDLCKGKGCDFCCAKFDLYEKCALSNIPIKYWNLKLKDIAGTIGVEHIKKYVEKLDQAYEDGNGIFISGKNGNGKTLAACSICKAALKRGYTVRFTFLNEIITSFTDAMYSPDYRLRLKKDIIEVDFLIIDDIDKAYIAEESKYVNSVLDSLFRTRVQNCRPVIITANVGLQEILKSKEEIFSKSLLSLFDESLLTVSFVGGDKRKDIKKEAMEKFFGDDDDPSS
jgi:DNA replication protein DnaC